MIMQKPRIAIICGGKTAFQSISLLALDGYLAGVAIGGKNNEAIDVLKKAVQQSKMPFIHIADKKELSEPKNWLMSINADYVFSINFPYIITEDLLNLLPEKWFNFHMGSLPKYRGAMPIFEVIKAGEKETAIAVHNMTAYFTRTDGTTVSQSVSFTGKQSTYYWAGEDHDAAGKGFTASGAQGAGTDYPLMNFQ